MEESATLAVLLYLPHAVDRGADGDSWIGAGWILRQIGEENEDGRPDVGYSGLARTESALVGGLEDATQLHRRPDLRLIADGAAQEIQDSPIRRGEVSPEGHGQRPAVS